MALEDAARMRQLPKALDPMVSAHAGVADPAERCVMVDHMPGPVVDGDAARMCAPQHIVARRGVMPEAIQREGPRPAADEGDRVVLLDRKSVV